MADADLRAYWAKKRKESNARHIAAGKCLRCGKPKGIGGKAHMCAVCYTKVKNYMRRHMNKVTAARMAAGKCRRCGKRKASKGSTSCKPCRQYQNAWRKQKRAR